MSEDLSKAIDSHFDNLSKGKVAKESKSIGDYSAFDPSEYKNPFKTLEDLEGDAEASPLSGTSSGTFVGASSGTSYGVGTGGGIAWGPTTTTPGGGYVTTTPGSYVVPPTSWGTSITTEKEESTTPKDILEMVDNLKIEILEDVLDDLEDAKNTSEIVRVIAKIQRKLKRLKKEEE